MLHFSNFDRKTITPIWTKDLRSELVSNNIFTFDIETTSCFNVEGKWVPFDKNKFEDIKENSKFYTQCDRIGFCYLWQFSIDGQVFYGRKIEEFYIFLEQIRSIFIGKLFIFVHNLSFEFQFLRNIFNPDNLEVFARKKRRPIFFQETELNIEFRCTYFLTNLPLRKLKKNYNLKTEKLDNFDYNVIRNSFTPLTERQMEYGENDVIILHELIEYFKNIYANIYNIPRTQTGIIRRKVKSIYKKDVNYLRKIGNLQETDPDRYKDLVDIFWGGYTHANVFHSNEILTNVYSWDKTSSYPSQMQTEFFPMSPFRYISNIEYLDELSRFSEYIFFIDIEFYGLTSIKENTFLSYSKCIDAYKTYCDNGRIMNAEYIRYKMTDIDLGIVLQCYKYDDYNIKYIAIAKKARLDKRLLELCADLFINKNTLETVDYSAYMQSKEMFNSVYGMMVTNLLNPPVIFTDEWGIDDKFTYEKQKQQLAKQLSKKPYLSYAWGVWIIAYARRDLWHPILKIDGDVVYCDTDSCKYIYEHDDVFENFNVEFIKKLKQSCYDLDMDYNKFDIINSKGKRKILGVFEKEETSDYFKTLGAKRYCSEINNKVKLTISGVSKEEGVKKIKSINDFNNGTIFDYDHSGRTIMDYIENQTCGIVTDDYGNSQEINYKYGICAIPSTYDLTIGVNYDMLLTAINESSHEIIYEELFDVLSFE